MIRDKEIWEGIRDDFVTPHFLKPGLEPGPVDYKRALDRVFYIFNLYCFLLHKILLKNRNISKNRLFYRKFGQMSAPAIHPQRWSKS